MSQAGVNNFHTKMDYRYNSVGFSISEENLYWVIIEGQDDGKIELKEIEKIPLKESLDFQNLLNQKNRQIIFETLQSHFLTQKFSKYTVNLSIDSSLSYIIKIPIEKSLSTKELKEHLIWEFNQHFYDEDYNNYLLSFHPIKGNNEQFFDSVLFLAIQKSYINFFRHLFEDLGLSLNITDVDHFSAETVCQFTYEHFPDSNNFILTIKPGFFEFSFYEKGNLMSFRQVQYQKTDDIVKYFEEKISPLLKKNKNLINKIYVCGTKVKTRLIDDLNSVTPVGVILINPFRKFIINKAVLNSPVYENFHEFTPALGIALRR